MINGIDNCPDLLPTIICTMRAPLHRSLQLMRHSTRIISLSPPACMHVGAILVLECLAPQFPSEYVSSVCRSAVSKGQAGTGQSSRDCATVPRVALLGCLLYASQFTRPQAEIGKGSSYEVDWYAPGITQFAIGPTGL